ncbi:MAG: outer membrane lipid asymmetry maintenance protein MlaD [Candidatus Thiodiazotropha sp. (ex Lucinoma aequizonata)]|nr:outer membrane lipid asymmetry maintenance protein MlaD [Candidatus Thiodiazotropha sp. (ex Lucinoma aequizonata)]MCU7887120.1 outer membrane lipid asymmetry maintenance protein MlaD [Candidatus Thiodiazotropha sp. (ex Lucinoma aequizonata)]MCU7896135.1 outer membrane lipid asymmetry maintenance protein MlaD [Candidatus Thiodiazotropha sp. (ex Lucinoma aequizonata)]MCU7898267.1 outer membrane lipid asymmetry maintenance protein MlaD [Candidatus Thiodiazotropha sp. (ex Lucinoma aequizonata)]M
MNTRGLEITVGAFIAAGLVALFFLAMQVSNLASITGGKGYLVTARFDNIGGLKVRSPVSMGGVRIGRVVDISYDQSSFEAVVSLSIDPVYTQIPDDSIAKIYTSGLLGEQYIALDPGGSLESLQQGHEVMMTQSALVLEEIVGRFLFSKAEENAISEEPIGE